LRDIDAEEVEKMAKESMRTMVKLQKQFGTSNSAASTILSLMSNELKKINELKPIIDVMCSASLKDRHWQQIKLITGSSNDHLKDLTLREVLMLSVHDEENLKLLKENIDKAKKQDRLEKILAGMQKEWSSVCFELKTFKDTEIPILVGTNIEIMQNMLDDHVMQS
jgi:heterodisulfide reductase subunit A-like polyferredoxin